MQQFGRVTGPLGGLDLVYGITLLEARRDWWSV